MWTWTCLILIVTVGLTASLPAESPVLRKLDSGLRYQYATDSKGEAHLVDLWLTAADIYETARYNAVSDNVYHLFTRANPTLSQPLVMNNPEIVKQSNYNSEKKTVVLLHGWRDSAVSNFNTVLVAALLQAEDLNVIVVDWSSGSSSINYRLVILNTISSGEAVANFIQWLNNVSGSTPAQFHVVGHGFGGHQAGIVGRNLQGRVSYITGLDPALIGWVNNVFRFQRSDAQYTEVIHTNYGVHGYLADLAHVDIYPNGGISMPGCDTNVCDHERSFFYFAESIVTGGFTSQECLSYHMAVLNMCSNLPGRIEMGGLKPKPGRTGVFWLETNAAPPFSKS